MFEHDLRLGSCRDIFTSHLQFFILLADHNIKLGLTVDLPVIDGVEECAHWRHLGIEEASCLFGGMVF